VRLTKKQRRRILGAVLGVAYLGVFVWLVSPLWGTAGDTSSRRAHVRAVPRGRSVGIASLGKSKQLPESLPGSNPTPATTPEANGFETVSEGSSETVSEGGSGEASISPESGETSTGSSSGGESSQPQATKIVSSEG
jgi:hypothetical protein